MKFLYTAKNQQGEAQSGVIEASSKDAALSTLQGFGLVVLQMREEKPRSLFDTLFSGFRRTSTRNIAVFARQLATLISAEVPLVTALRTMFQQTRNTYLKEAIFDIVTDIEAGASLSQAFSRHEVIFSPFFVQMVRSAEITGRLQEVFEYLADYLETQSSLNAKIVSALIYPVFVLALFAAVIAIMVLIVIPGLREVFLAGGMDIAELPFVTRILFGLEDFVVAYGIPLLIVGIVGLVSFFAYFTSPEGRALIGVAMLHVPYFGNIVRQIYLARFAETTSVMIKGNIPVAQALESAGDVVANVHYREIIFDAAEAVRRGELISEALARSEKDFPALVTQMIAIGEQTGRLDELLHRVSEFYSREVGRVLSNISEIIQPVLIVVLGIFVGILIWSIILPIQQLAQQAGG